MYQNLGCMAFDAAGNLYVGGDDEIVVFAPGSVTPARIIAGSQTEIVSIDGIAVDAGGVIYVTNGLFGAGSVLEFAAGANGNVAPLRTITGVGSATLYDPSGIALDRDGNLFVSGYLAPVSGIATSASIFEFAPGASGYAAPLKTIAGGATGLAGVGSLRLDGAGNLYVLVVTPGPTSGGTTYLPSISVFAPGANGNVAPVSSFTSPAWNAPGYGQIGLD